MSNLHLEKILIVDDHATVRTGLRFILESLGIDKTNITECSTLIEATHLTATKKYSCIFFDLHFKEQNCLSLLQKIHTTLNETKLFIYTQSDSPLLLQSTLKYGVHSIFTKDTELDELTLQIQKALCGIKILPMFLKDSMVSLQLLTPRELEVAKYIIEGMGNKEIAQNLNCSDQTIKSHRASILKKIGAENSVEAAVWLVQKGYLNNSSELSNEI